MTDAGWVAVATIAVALINMLGSVGIAFVRAKYGIVSVKNGGNGWQITHTPAPSETKIANP